LLTFPLGFPANKADRQAVEAACEKAVFAGPVRREICYRAARAAQHDTTYVARGDAAYAAELAPLRFSNSVPKMIGVAPTLEEVGEPTGASASPLIWMTGGVSVASFVGGETWELPD
jgi:hypothetical protein